MVDQNLEVAEVRILRRRRSYRGQFIGGTFLFVIFACTAAVTFLNNGEERSMGGYLLGFMVLWAGIASHAHARLDHIRTLDRLRPKAVDAAGITDNA